MRAFLVVGSFGVALAALAAGVSPGKAQSAATLYPYCALRAGSSSCYHLTLESCGRSCISNPAYIGDARARAALAGQASAGNNGRVTRKADRSRIGANVAGSIDALGPRIDAGARAEAGRTNDFEGWPTGYLVNRFGDRQAQGRF